MSWSVKSKPLTSNASSFVALADRLVVDQSRYVHPCQGVDVVAWSRRSAGSARPGEVAGPSEPFQTDHQPRIRGRGEGHCVSGTQRPAASPFSRTVLAFPSTQNEGAVFRPFGCGSAHTSPPPRFVRGRTSSSFRPVIGLLIANALEVASVCPNRRRHGRQP